jgi:hypothetical protein
MCNAVPPHSTLSVNTVDASCDASSIRRRSDRRTTAAVVTPCARTRTHVVVCCSCVYMCDVCAYLCVLCVRACLVLCPPVTVCVEWSRWNGRASANLFAEGEQTCRLNRLRRPQLNNQQHHTPHTHTDRRGGRYTTQWQRNRRGCSCSVLKEQFCFYSLACSRSMNIHVNNLNSELSSRCPFDRIQ